MKFRIQHDYTKSHPRKPPFQFGPQNEGVVIEGETKEAALAAWNAAQLPGHRINPFYILISRLPD